MKIRIEIDETIEDDELVIRSKSFSPTIYRLQKILSEELEKKTQLVFSQGKTDYYIDVDKIIFFETFDGEVEAHTAKNIYSSDYKLYELEEILSRNFVRVSKSTIINMDHISSITKNLTSASIVEFDNSLKTTYISRHYYKALKDRMEEVKGYEK